MTDGNGNRVTAVVAVSDGSDRVVRVVAGGLWEYWVGTGAVRVAFHFPAYLGTTCSGQPYGYVDEGGVLLQQRWVMPNGSAYKFDPTGTLVVPNADDSVVYRQGNGCSNPRTFAQFVGDWSNTMTGLWPMTSATRPTDLPGPLVVSAQN